MFIDSHLGVFAHFGVAAVLNTVDLITASTLHCNRMETDNTLQQIHDNRVSQTFKNNSTSQRLHYNKT